MDQKIVLRDRFQLRFLGLYVFEIKFLKNPIKRQVIGEVREKIQRISLPRGTAVFPVLIHVNRVMDRIYEEDYFHFIFNFSNLLHGNNCAAPIMQIRYCRI